MSAIEKTYGLKNIPSDSFYQDCLEIFKSLGAVQIEEKVSSNNVKEINGIVPSIWGWGGVYMVVFLDDSQNGITSFTLKGNIEQLAMSPLTKLMDSFLAQLQTVLEEKYGQTFEYEKLTRFIPNFSNDSHEKAQLILFAKTLLGCASLFLVLYAMQYILEGL